MSHANSVAQQACDLLAHRKLVASSGVTDPDGWLVTVKRDMRAKHHATFMAALDGQPSLSAEQLAASVTAERAQEAETEPLNPSSRLPTVAELAETWSSEGCLNAEQTRERITAIKASLKKETA